MLAGGCSSLPVTPHLTQTVRGASNWGAANSPVLLLHPEHTMLHRSASMKLRGAGEDGEDVRSETLPRDEDDEMATEVHVDKICECHLQLIKKCHL